MIYTLTCNPAIDYVVALGDRLQPGKINRNTREEVQYGGKGINVSRMLRNLGVDSVAMGFLAGFTGLALEQGLEDLGLKTRFIHVRQGMTRINVKIKAGEETEINGIGPEITPEEFGFLETLLKKLRPGDILVLSGSLPGSLPGDTYEQILASLSDRGVLAVVDTAGEALKGVLAYHPFLIKPNLRELEEVFQTSLQTEEEILRAARELQSLGGRNILVSMAERGALLLEESGNVHRLPSPRGQVVNSVGAGDAMVAGFLAGWLKTGDFRESLKLGIASGSATAFSLGMAEESQVAQLLSRIPEEL